MIDFFSRKQKSPVTTCQHILPVLRLCSMFVDSPMKYFSLQFHRFHQQHVDRFEQFDLLKKTILFMISFEIIRSNIIRIHATCDESL